MKNPSDQGEAPLYPGASSNHDAVRWTRLTSRIAAATLSGGLLITQAGAAQAGPVFTQQTGGANPFPNSNQDIFPTTPAFADLTGDGDSDGFVGGGPWLQYYRNTGTAGSPAFSYVDYSCGATPVSGVYPYPLHAPAFVDIDGD
ncbi:MAG: hypothetical protein AB1896_23725, partial [Thermodesulfobacteriota bacterium]